MGKNKLRQIAKALKKIKIQKYAKSVEQIIRKKKKAKKKYAKSVEKIIIEKKKAKLKARIRSKLKYSPTWTRGGYIK